MNALRETFAALLYITAILLTIYMCTVAFHWSYLAVTIIAYLTAYWIWPSKREGQRHDTYWWLDIIELFIELPFRIIGWLFRSLKNSDAPDIDL